MVLDTNVVSELMKEDASPRVLTWLSKHSAQSMFLTALTEAEVRLGLARLPAGKRRRVLESAADGLFDDFRGRIMAFDSDAARMYAMIGAHRRSVGHPISVIDAQIAAIVRSRSGILVTRNTKDFAGCEIDLFNPWLDDT